MASNKWTLEIRRRLAGSQAGKGSKYADTRMQAARQKLVALKALYSHERNEAEVRAALKEFDEAYREIGGQLSNTAPLNP